MVKTWQRKLNSLPNDVCMPTKWQMATTDTTSHQAPVAKSNKKQQEYRPRVKNRLPALQQNGP
jgi:hypothetical protein